MFWNRWSLTWLGIWVVGASLWGMFLVSAVVARWPAVRPFRINGDVSALPLFFLTWFTLPTFSIYLGGLVLGWIVVRLSQLPLWSSRWWTLIARADFTTLIRSLRHQPGR